MDSHRFLRGIAPGVHAIGVNRLLNSIPLCYYSKVVSTHLWNRPLNLSQQAVKGILSRLGRGIAWGVLQGCVVTVLELYLLISEIGKNQQNEGNQNNLQEILVFYSIKRCFLPCCFERFYPSQWEPNDSNRSVLHLPVQTSKTRR